MNKPSVSSQRWVWLVLLVMLVLLALSRSIASGGEVEAWLGRGFLVQARLVLGLLAALVGAWIALKARRDESGHLYPALDGSFILLVLSWVMISVVALAQEAMPDSTAASAMRYMAYQLSAAATLNFLLNTAKVHSPGVRTLIAVQLLVGLGFLIWFFGGHNAAWSLEAWRISNAMAFALVFLGICRIHLHDTRSPPWLSVGACLVGFGMGANDMAAADGVTLQVTGMHNVFSAYLLLIWLMLTNRLGGLSAPHKPHHIPSEHSILGADFADSYLQGAPPPVQQAGAAVELAQVKRQFAQELHDGVGSQLVNMLSSLDRGVPQQRDMALAIEQCLLDVKILVDDIDGGEECVLDALARLRYRVQPSLDRLGMTLSWDIQPDPALEQLQDERSRQVLRIVQEALANVMRHSRAQNVRVTCCYQPGTDSLVVEVLDDGRGFDAMDQDRSRGGKGLIGMRRRAESISGQLELLSTPGEGTRVSLSLALGINPVQLAAEKPRNATMPSRLVGLSSPRPRREAA
jgi:signal transduction histidine kinase